MSEALTRYEALMQVRSHFASDQAMADAFSRPQPTVWRWLNQSKQLPAEGGECLLAEQLTGVSRHHLRPDVYGPHPSSITTPPTWQGVDRGAGRVHFQTGRALKAAAR